MSERSLRALIFDVDGTLADTEESHRRAFNAAFAAAGLEWWWNRDTYRDLLRVAGGRHRIRGFAEREDPEFTRRADFDAVVAAIHANKTQRYDAALREQPLALRPGVARLFASADEAGLKLAIATTTTAANLDALLSPSMGAAWRSRFAAIVSGDDVAHLKPAPDAYLAALARLGLEASEALAFEDSANGIRSAHGAGLAVVVTPTWYSLAEALPDAFVCLPHLGDPENPLPPDSPGTPYVDIARLREWHCAAYAATAAERTRACS